MKDSMQRTLQGLNEQSRAIALKAQESINQHQFMPPEKARLVKFGAWAGAALGAAGALAVVAAAPVVAGALAVAAAGVGAGGVIFERTATERQRIRQEQQSVLTEMRTFLRDLKAKYDKEMARPETPVSSFALSSDLVQYDDLRQRQQLEQRNRVELTSSDSARPSSGPSMKM